MDIPMNDKTKETLTVAETAGELGVSELTVRRYLYRGLLGSTRTPGGHHRIPIEEIEAFRSGTTQGGVTHPEFGEPALWRRLRRLEAEVETLKKQLAVLGAGCSTIASEAFRQEAETSTSVPGNLELVILGPGCPGCNRLATMTREIVRELDRDDLRVRHEKDMDSIVQHGPLLTPALLLGDKMITSGSVPWKRRLRELIKAALGDETED